MIQLYFLNLFNFLKDFKLPETLEEIQLVHWILAIVVVFLLILLLIKIWQKLIDFLIRILFIVCAILIIYLIIAS